MATNTGLEDLVNQIISVITNDGRNIVGVLKGFDQATNIILDESHERVFSTKCHLFNRTLRNKHIQIFKIGLVSTLFGERISMSGHVDTSLDQCYWRFLEGVQQHVLGLYIIRGDNIGVIGELDEELDAGLDLSKLRAHPLKPVVH
ncbi:sm-like protein LSM8 isoform X2 [Arabidopsis lyrata subsp. lyrata]|uniref:sm-like protein LSM8 isoform X2 n=1 Tax=Arabidopsis lyrata subsp. lyrata TaxID=81972 RepID=UPI000A29CBCF|nr:sm-like protein LSM8 isoform X2 [Arabidopsis lyrata subsp. lyrata]|eukprot:XP_020889692.1 sm-like protein LSM8 isoform X2 [Arabidopsis lyrata subsp. lyrata]